MDDECGVPWAGSGCWASRSAAALRAQRSFQAGGTGIWGNFFEASGRRIGSIRSVPFHTTKFDLVYRFSPSGWRAWGHDIALTPEGRPRIVYTRRVAGRDTFGHAYHNGTRWISRRMVGAGAGRQWFTSGGASLDHEDPRIVYL